MGLAVTYRDSILGTGASLEYVKEGVTTEVVKEVVEVKELDRRIQEAQDKARLDVETKAKSAYDSAYNQAMDEVKLEVVKEYKKEVQQLETDLSKKVGQY